MAEITEEILHEVIKRRKSVSHKGNYGRVLLIGGSENYGGAIIMAAEGALNAGSGLVAVASHQQNLSALHSRDPEVMFIDWQDKTLGSLIKKMNVVVCGPGLGTNDFAKKILLTVKDMVTAKQTLILDASALDLIAQDSSLMPVNAGNIILTPHQMEWQRLSRIHIPFQTDEANIAALAKLVPNKNVVLVLKSNHTHIYIADGQIFVNPLGNPGMATGGMGDTLAGIIAGFVAQFGSQVKTVLAAVYLHSLAGDEIYKENYLVRPTKLAALLPKLMKSYVN
ncbi:NAD(P)H-hydrate dehydratase [Lactobacillus sp. ESL0791]|uniref:NAD(P)H-hydrate dehydratase n=1 Tax=Lactobacillus sp. ESL0791 TaxID=2983234 RepID=UPI0023F669BC|nr:NAD(P)H-hydrate dehydratase [Lactobacillus sp. ESL0791]MDF7638496.1 NAD(P)H-hydrate dehydratase [Lactobacillus sp. ESL0791]